MSSQSSSSSSPDTAALDDPLIALTHRCNGDLRKVLTSFFSFLHRRTDFYMVPHDDDWNDGKAKMGFRQGEAEKILVASFRQFPLRRIPKQQIVHQQAGDTEKSTTAHSSAKPEPHVPDDTQDKNNLPLTKDSSPREDHSKMDNEILLTKEGLQIPVGNGGTTKRYKWTQTLDECTVFVGIPGSLRAKDLLVEIKPTEISIRQREPSTGATDPTSFVEGNLVETVVPDESTWTLEGGVLVLLLFKKTKTFWPTVIKGDDKIDTSLVDSRRHIRDYDESTQAMMRKIMFDQSQTSLGLLTSDQLANAKPLTTLTMPPGVEYIDSKTLESSKK